MPKLGLTIAWTPSKIGWWDSKCGFRAGIFCFAPGVWKELIVMNSIPISPDPLGSKHISQWPPKTKRCSGEKLGLSVLLITGFLFPHSFLTSFFCMQTTELTRGRTRLLCVKPLFDIQMRNRLTIYQQFYEMQCWPGANSKLNYIKVETRPSTVHSEGNICVWVLSCKLCYHKNPKILKYSWKEVCVAPSGSM